MAQVGEDAPQCRVCWGQADEPGPQGLADLLLERPCGCRGHLGHVHLSCLHGWQLRRVQLWQDPSLCDICRQPYAVPPGAWEALVAAGGIDAAERQQVAEWQPPAIVRWLQRALEEAALMQQRQQEVQRQQGLLRMLARGAAGAFKAASWCLTTTMTLSTWYCHTMLSYLDSSQLPATELPRPPRLHRIQPDACETAAFIVALAITERSALGSWQAVWQHGMSTRYTTRIAAAFGSWLLFAGLHWLTDAERGAPGAPRQQPWLAAFAEGCADLSFFAACASVSYWPFHLQFVRWLLSTLWGAPIPDVLPATVGARLADAWQAQREVDKAQAATAGLCLPLFQQRPWAVRCLGAVLSMLDASA